MSDETILLTESLPEPMALRSLLTCKENPRRAPDYIVKIQSISNNQNYVLTLHYIPDRLLLNQTGLDQYLEALNWYPDDGWETLLFMILDDLNNELVPRYIQIKIEASGPTPSLHLIEDRQPAWDNPVLLYRIPGM